MKVLVLCTVMLLAGCSYPTSVIKSNYLPTGSTNVESIGNGWFSFEFKGKKFLYYRHGAGDSTHSGVTEISQ